MRPPALISVDDYLARTFDPDREYVEGMLLERNVGEKEHSKLQRELVLWFGNRRRLLGLNVFPEQRIQVSASRYRVPDLCVYLGHEPEGQVFNTPPFICIEILSPSDSLMSMQELIDDYLAMGVHNVWLISPSPRRAWVCSPGQTVESKDWVLRTTEPLIEVPLLDVFSEMDS